MVQKLVRWTVNIGVVGMLLFAFPLLPLVVTDSSAVHAAEQADLPETNTATRSEMLPIGSVLLSVQKNSNFGHPYRPDETAEAIDWKLLQYKGDFRLSALESGKAITVTMTFKNLQPSPAYDHIEIVIVQPNPTSNGGYYIHDHYVIDQLRDKGIFSESHNFTAREGILNFMVWMCRDSSLGRKWRTAMYDPKQQVPSPIAEPADYEATINLDLRQDGSWDDAQLIFNWSTK